MLVKVLRHLSFYWATVPPQREHVRHAVKTRISVLQGFEACLTVFAGDVARLGVERGAESWVVENVSLGGFCAGTEEIGEWLKIGILLCIQPEGGDNWVLGMVRRCSIAPDARQHRYPDAFEESQKHRVAPANLGVPGVRCDPRHLAA